MNGRVIVWIFDICNFSFDIFIQIDVIRLQIAILIAFFSQMHDDIQCEWKKSYFGNNSGSQVNMSKSNGYNY